MDLLLNRREWLRIGGLATLGWSSASAKSIATKIPSVLIVYTSGGMSQFESWDPKPDAPAEIRGAFSSIPTSITGVRFSEHLPRMAKLAHRLTLIRSMTHDDLDHGSATYLALTGQFHQRKSSNPPISPNDSPSYGAILKRVRPVKHLPYTAVHINGPVLVPEIPAPGQNGGFLGRGYEPLMLGDVTESSTLLEGLTPQANLPAIRLNERQALLQQLEQTMRMVEPDPNPFTKQAFDLLASPRTRQLFDLDQESDRVRERYGNHRSGQACLLARRLLEGGVPLVTVFFNHGIRGQDKDPQDTDQYGWDTHNDIFDSMKDHLLPRFDWSFSALLEDLEQRGLLEQTLVVCLGEFGRAPLVALEKNFVGSSPGRKHWAACYSIVLAGAGLKKGFVLGASDKMGAYPSAHPVTPADLAATLFQALGIDPASHYEDLLNRPVPITSGKIIQELW